MQKITPFLWFDDSAEEAMKFYTSIFKNSKIGSVTRYDEAGSKAAGRPKGSVMTAAFQLEGQEFVAINGGPVRSEEHTSELQSPMYLVCRLLLEKKKKKRKVYK